MAADPLSLAVFPDVAERRAHYESYYLRACDPDAPRGVWIRYTVHKRPGERPLGSLWFTLFDADAGEPLAAKETVAPDELAVPDGGYIRVGESLFEPARATGAVGPASWELTLTPDEQPFRHLPGDWMYSAPLPRTKSLSPVPAARFAGTVRAGGRELDVEGWRGMVGHNWGSQHAERWMWMHGIGFEGHPEAWLDGILGRIKLGPLTTPWVANACLSLDGQRHRLGGPRRARATEVHETPQRATFVLPGDGIRVRGRMESAPGNVVGWVYADPDGSGEHHTANCSIAALTLTVEREGRPTVELRTASGAAYELGMRERDHGVPIQPFPDP